MGATSRSDDEREALACVLLGVRRIPLDPEWPRHADALAQADAILAAGYRKHPEPEWEYRWAREDGEHAWPFGPMDEEEGETREATEAAPRLDPEPEYFDGTRFERRTKAVPAGPWVPVGEGEQRGDVSR